MDAGAAQGGGDGRHADVTLRPTVEDDLDSLFEFQNDAVANEMAAFPPRDYETFKDHWHSKVFGDPSVVSRTILEGEEIVGSIGCFSGDGLRLVGYWLGRRFWGRGIATEALGLFLGEVTERPLHAIVAARNVPSIRVLEKTGFSLSPDTVPGVDANERVFVLAR